MIPRKIHILWIGPKNPPWHWINTWAEKNPDFEVKVWRESDLFPLANQKQFDWYYNQGRFSGCSNVFNPEVLHREGGIYVGADSVCNRPLADAPFLDAEFFAAYTADTRPYKRMFDHGYGAEAGHPILKRYIGMLGKLPATRRGLWPSWDKTGSTLLYKAVEPDLDRVTIISQDAFFSELRFGEFTNTSGVNYSSHFWGTTKKLYG